MREVLRAYQDAVAGEVARFEGHVAKFMGDGVLAYFGWPRAHEDDAERAVRAGLAVAAAVARLGRAERRAAGRPGRDRDRPGGGRRPGRRGRGPGGGGRRRDARTWPPGCRRWPSRAPWSIAEGTRRLLGGLFELDATSAREPSRASPSRCAACRVLGEGAAEGRFEALHARRPHAAGRARAGAGAAARPLGAGQGGRGPGRAARGRARHRQVAPRPRPARAAGATSRTRRSATSARPIHQNSALHPVIDQLERAAGLRPRRRPPEHSSTSSRRCSRTRPRTCAEAAAAARRAPARIPADGPLSRRWT